MSMSVTAKAMVAVFAGAGLSTAGLVIMNVSQPSAPLAASATTVSAKPAPAVPPDSVSAHDALLREIDRMAAHPDDPDRPAGVRGVTDSELSAKNVDDIGNLIATGVHVASEQLDEPRYLFALGRAALLHGEPDLAWDLLSTAANNGSAAAHAYMAHLTDEIEDTEELLEIAVDGGFTPASAWLAETRSIKTEQQAAQTAVATPGPPKTVQPPILDYSKFNRPDLVRALHTGDMATLNANVLESAMYIGGLQETWLNPQVLFLVEDTTIRLDIDPDVSHHLARKMTVNRQGMDQAVDAGLQSIFGPLIAIAKTRQQGGTIMDEVNASNTAIMNSPAAQLDVLKRQAMQDAERLAIMYDVNPAAFRQVYAGIRAFASS